MFVVVVVWFCCSFWPAFLILTYYSNLMHQFLLHWVICFGGYLIVHTEFFEKDLGFFGIRKKIIFGFFYLFLIWSPIHKIVDGRGRNLMCHCTLPSRLVEHLVCMILKAGINHSGNKFLENFFGCYIIPVLWFHFSSKLRFWNSERKSEKKYSPAFSFEVFEEKWPPGLGQKLWTLVFI